MNPQPGLPGLFVLAAALGLTSCQLETCPPLGLCMSGVRLEGAQDVPEGTTQIEVRFCSKDGCVAGTLDVAQSWETACVEQQVGAFHGSVCATRQGNTEVRLNAHLVETQSESIPIPPDGDKYTLEVVDAESNDVLVDRECAAEYVPPPSSDDCNQCWQATLKL